jgi:hypothetical protein
MLLSLATSFSRSYTLPARSRSASPNFVSSQIVLIYAARLTFSSMSAHAVHMVGVGPCADVNTSATSPHLEQVMVCRSAMLIPHEYVWVVFQN